MGKTAQDFQDNKVTQVVEVAASARVSGVIQLSGAVLEAIQWDTAMTSTTATIEGSMDGVNYYPIVPIGGTADSIVVAASTISYINAQITRGVHWIQIAMGSTEAAKRTLTVGLTPAPG
jgi:hypothetical protein